VPDAEAEKVEAEIAPSDSDEELPLKPKKVFSFLSVFNVDIFCSVVTLRTFSWCYCVLYVALVQHTLIDQFSNSFIYANYRYRC